MKKLLVAVDGSDLSWKVLDFADDMAKKYDAELMVYTVFKPSESEEMMAKLDMSYPMAAKEAAKLGDLGDKVVAEAKKRIDPTVKAIYKDEVGDAPEMILETAEEYGADMIIMGSKGMSKIRETLSGSVSDYVVRNSKVPVLVVK